MKKVFSIINALIAMAFFISTTFVCPVCTALMANGRPMSCHYTHIMIMVVAGIILLFALIAIALNKKLFYLISYIATAALSLLCYLAPERIIKIGNMKLNGWAIGLCKAGHACSAETMPIVTVIVIISCTANIIFSLYTFISRRK